MTTNPTRRFLSIDLLGEAEHARLGEQTAAMIFRIGHVDRTMTIRNRMRRVADVGVESLVVRRTWRIEGELAVIVEIEIASFGFTRRPGVKRGPGVAAGLK